MSATKLQQLARKCDLALRPLDRDAAIRHRFPKSAQFSATWTDTCGLLAHELDALDAKDRVLQVEAPADQFRLDGQPRAGIKPGRMVVLSFATKDGPLLFPCDTYEAGFAMAGWECNIRALALGLQALRAVDRYGISPRHEQYRGWAALPAPAEEITMDALRAADILRLYGGGEGEAILRSREAGEAAYRVAVQVVHPDKGGTGREFRLVNEARVVLRRHWEGRG